MLSWWALTSAVAKHSHTAWSSFSMYAGVVLVFLLLPFELSCLGLSLVMIGVGVNGLLGIAQRGLRYEPFKRSPNRQWFNPIGLIGNSNMLGNFLVPNFFLSVYLAQEMSMWWLVMSVLIGYAVWMTRCRGAYAGLLCGSLYAAFVIRSGWISDFFILGMVCFVTLVVCWKRNGTFAMLRSKHAITGRFRFWRIALEAIKHAPITGVGFNCLKLFVPHIQRELNEKSGGEFMNPITYTMPYPQRCHNDLLQLAADTGIPGALAWVGLIVMSLMAPVDVLIKAGLVGMLVGGVFLHNLAISTTNVWMWFIIFICLKSYNIHIPMDVPLYVNIGAVVVLLLALQYHAHEFITDLYVKSFFDTNDTSKLHKALRYTDDNGYALVHLAANAQSQCRAWEAFRYTMKSINSYDGNIRLWELWTNAGKACLLLGAPVISEHCAKLAIALNPHDEGGKKLLVDTNNILTRGVKIIRNAPPVEVGSNEFTINDTKHQGVCTGTVAGSNQAAS